MKVGDLCARAFGLAAVTATVLLATACDAADSNASPLGAGAQQIVDRASGGETIVLPATATGPLKIKDRHFARPVTIDLSHARIEGILILSSSGLRIVNGTIKGPFVRNSHGIAIRDSRDVEVNGVTVTDAAAGITMMRSQDVTIANNTIRRMLSDGIMIAGSQRVKIRNNSCSEFFPTPKVWSPTAQLLRDGDHPDCIQAWSIRGLPPTSDVEVVGNRGDGNFQGIFFGNTTINGVDDGGYDRVTITDNDMRIAWYNGIHLTDGRDARITRNRISTVPGSRDIRGTVFDRPIKAYISVVRGTVIACDNIVMDFPTGEGTRRC